MTNTTLPDGVLKTDTLGRVHTPRARREALLEEFERSGVSGKKFAAMVGVNYQTFASWVQKWREVRGEPAVAAPKKPVSETLRLVEAVIATESTKEAGVGEVSLWVQLPGGAQVAVRDVRQVALVAELLRALVERAC
jgi:transposase-like protein